MKNIYINYNKLQEEFIYTRLQIKKSKVVIYK